MGGMGQMMRAMADRLRGQGQGGQPPMPGGPQGPPPGGPPGGPPPGMQMPQDGTHQGTPMQGMHRPEQQTGMAGLGQAAGKGMQMMRQAMALRGGK